MANHLNFTHINQFRNIISDISHEYNGQEKPVLSFIGTIKLHGTNAGVCYDGHTMWVQSRNNIITVENDNAGFALFVETHKSWFEKTLKSLYREGYIVSLYGEWCGGNIQKGVALNQLSKKFVLFALRYTNKVDISDHTYLKPTISSFEDDIHNIYDFKTWSISIDFRNPGHAQNQIADWVLEVESECPFSKSFGVSGIGEGIVFTHFNDAGERVYLFKAKGDKHSSSKVKKIAHIDVEKLDSINEFVDFSVTDNRLNQAIEQVFTLNAVSPSVKSTGDFIRWVVNDILREELDTMIANNLEPGDVSKYISCRVKSWFFDYLNTSTTN